MAWRSGRATRGPFHRVRRLLDDSDGTDPSGDSDDGLVDAAGTPTHHHFFYHGRDYGSESLYGPISVFLNRGYDVLQLRPGQRSVFRQSYGSDGKRGAAQSRKPVPRHRRRRVRAVLPNGGFAPQLHAGHGLLGPDYTLHLIGGGMTFRALSEWFEDHRFPIAWLWSGIIILGSAFVNETLENKGNSEVQYGCDRRRFISSTSVACCSSASTASRAFFSEDVRVMDWSLQPTFTFPGGNLNNEGNYFGVKWPLPFYYTGDSRHSSIWDSGRSAACPIACPVKYSGPWRGAGSLSLDDESRTNLKNHVSFAPSVGVFIDRHDSLLASLRMRTWKKTSPS